MIQLVLSLFVLTPTLILCLSLACSHSSWPPSITVPKWASYWTPPSLCWKCKTHLKRSEAIKQRLLLFVGDFRATDNPEYPENRVLQAATLFHIAVGLSGCQDCSSPTTAASAVPMFSDKGLKLRSQACFVASPQSALWDKPWWLPHYSSSLSRYQGAWCAGLEIRWGVMCQPNRLSYNRAWLVFTLAS